MTDRAQDTEAIRAILDYCAQNANDEAMADAASEADAALDRLVARLEAAERREKVLRRGLHDVMTAEPVEHSERLLIGACHWSPCLVRRPCRARCCRPRRNDGAGMSACPNCGQAGMRDVTHGCVRASFYPTLPQPSPLAPMQVGWKCPVCGMGNAPWMPYCTRCPTVTVTSGSASAAPGETEQTP
jgi:hypothetical protein